MPNKKQNGLFSWMPFAWCASEEAVGAMDDAHRPVEYGASANGTTNLGGSAATATKPLSNAEIAALVRRGVSSAISKEIDAEHRRFAREARINFLSKNASARKVQKFLVANKGAAKKLKAERVAAVATIAKFLSTKIEPISKLKAERKEQKFIAKVKRTFDDLIEFRANKQIEVAQEKRAYRIKIAKRVLMVVSGFALLALGAWIVKGFLAARAAQAAAVNLVPVAPVVVAGVDNAPDLTAVPGFTPALDTAVQNMPSISAMPANGLDAAAADRIRVYMGLRA